MQLTKTPLNCNIDCKRNCTSHCNTISSWFYVSKNKCKSTKKFLQLQEEFKGTLAGCGLKTYNNTKVQKQVRRYLIQDNMLLVMQNM